MNQMYSMFFQGDSLKAGIQMSEKKKKTVHQP